MRKNLGEKEIGDERDEGHQGPVTQPASHKAYVLLKERTGVQKQRKIKVSRLKIDRVI